MPHTRSDFCFTRIAFLALCGCVLSACGASERLANVGKPPAMSPIENPIARESYQPISLPMPAQHVVQRQPNSLWDSTRQTFFKDQRASAVGDIVTVSIAIDDKAELDNESERSRSGGEQAGLSNLLGFEASLGKILPGAVDNKSLVGADSNGSYAGSGSIARDEKINLKLAAIITQILPNGNMVIHGQQEVRVNFEKRILMIDGVIRPQDISIENSIPHEKIAEARVSYGGQGHITDVQQPRYGQQIYDIIFPF